MNRVHAHEALKCCKLWDFAVQDFGASCEQPFLGRVILKRRATDVGFCLLRGCSSNLCCVPARLNTHMSTNPGPRERYYCHPISEYDAADAYNYHISRHLRQFSGLGVVSLQGHCWDKRRKGFPAKVSQDPFGGPRPPTLQANVETRPCQVHSRDVTLKPWPSYCTGLGRFDINLGDTIP